YLPALRFALRRGRLTLGVAVGLVVGTVLLATRMGSEFIPSLDEGDLAVQALRIPGTSLTQSLDMQFRMEKALMALPEVLTVFSRVGTAEVATDPMPPNISDGYVMLKPHDEWPDPSKSKAQLSEEIVAVLARQPGNAYEISQPIQLRFNELISGVRSDLGIKVYGDDLEQLLAAGNRIAAVVNGVEGAEGVKVEQVAGLPVLSIQPKRIALHRYGLNIAEVQDVLAAALGGEDAGTLFEGDRRFAIVVRLPEAQRGDLVALERLPIPLERGGYVPLAEVATLSLAPGPNQISRENSKRRLVVSANVRGRDLGSFVGEVQDKIAAQVRLPSGYW
ncbi:MAG: efflux RND transporter permease subunit, partial [Burkholderiales bacterium]